MLSTAFTRRFGCVHPLIQAGMAQEAGAALAAAVSNAGALGSIGSIGGTPERLAHEIRACRAATPRPFAVNVVTWDWGPAAAALLDVVLAERPPVVTLSFGDPMPALARCRDAGLATVVQVQDLPGADAALAARPDALVVQGNEAGGHTGRRGTLSFLAQVLERAGDVPVLAAGGIADGRGVAGVLAMGAAGAVLGTRFKASVECAVAEPLKQAIVGSDGDDTVYDTLLDAAYGLTWPHDVTGRALRNGFTAAWAGREAALREAVAAEPPRTFVGRLARDPATAINWAGESAGLVRAIEPAADIVARVMTEAERHLTAAAALHRG